MKHSVPVYFCWINYITHHCQSFLRPRSAKIVIMCVSLRWWFCLSAVLVIIPTLSSVQCANILAIFPHHGVSHWLFFRPIVTELVRRDHNVTLLSYYGINDFEMRSKSNYNEHLFKNLSSLTNTRDLQVRALDNNYYLFKYSIMSFRFSRNSEINGTWTCWEAQNTL